MNIRENFISENKEFIAEWEIKRKVGKVKYIVIGIIRFALFASAAVLLGNGISNKRLEITSSELISIIVISILAPVTSWFANESRYKKHIS